MLVGQAVKPQPHEHGCHLKSQSFPVLLQIASMARHTIIYRPACMVVLPYVWVLAPFEACISDLSTRPHTVASMVGQMTWQWAHCGHLRIPHWHVQVHTYKWAGRRSAKSGQPHGMQHH